MSIFSEAESQRIAAAIADAESRTSGEIVAVVAAESGRYLYVPFAIAAVAALFVPWPLIAFAWWTPTAIYATQLIVFALLLAVLLPRQVRMWFVPKTLKQAQTHRRAVEQFLSQNLQETSGRTGVLIFVSLAERHAEVLADRAIDAKVPAGSWQAIVDKLVGHLASGDASGGFIAAIGDAGALLAQHFPPGAANKNELPNRLIVLD